MPYTYETDGATIYKGSFATIRAEADLARFDDNHESIAVRMIHAAGMVDLAQHVHFQIPSAQQPAPHCKMARRSCAMPTWCPRVLRANVCLQTMK